MPTINQFKKATSKVLFLLDPYLDDQFYQQLNDPETLASDDRDYLLWELVISLQIACNPVHAQQLIIKLCDWSYRRNRTNLFVEGDFFSDLLVRLIQQIEYHNFAKLYFEQEKLNAFPAEYQWDERLGFIFPLMCQVAQRFDRQHHEVGSPNANYRKNLPNRLANVVFKKLIIDYDCWNRNQDTEQVHAELSLALEPNKTDPYFSTRLPQETNTGQVDDYFKYTADFAFEKTARHWEFMGFIKRLICDYQWELGGFAFFRGGVSIVIDGQSKRVPHRVGEIARLIQQYENNPAKATRDLFILYDAIKDKAQEALDNPRRNQKTSTREFYTQIVDNSYRDTLRIARTNPFNYPAFQQLVPFS